MGIRERMGKVLTQFSGLLKPMPKQPKQEMERQPKPGWPRKKKTAMAAKKAGKPCGYLPEGEESGLCTATTQGW